METIKVLLFTANPQGTAPLDLAREFREIDEEVSVSSLRSAVELILVPGTRPVDLLRKLNENRPQVIHFSRYGDPDAIILESDDHEADVPGPAGSSMRGRDERDMRSVRPGGVETDSTGQGQSHGVSKSALVNVLRACDEGCNLRLVVLDAGHTRSQAEALTEVVDCVVSMSRTISDRAAIKFAASFYGALAFGRSVQTAFEQGVARLNAEGIGEGDTPELLVRAGVDASRVVLVRPATGPSPPACASAAEAPSDKAQQDESIPPAKPDDIFLDDSLRTEAGLLLRIRDPQDKEAWEEFVAQYGPMIRAWCHHWFPRDTDDMVQEVFTRLIPRLQSFEYDPRKGRFLGWLKTFTQNLMARLKREQWPQVDDGEESPLDLLEAGEDLAARLAAEFDLELLEQAKRRVRERVHPHTWAAYLATAEQGRKPADVARELGMGVGAVFQAKYSMIAQLRHEIENLESLDHKTKAAAEAEAVSEPGHEPILDTEGSTLRRHTDISFPARVRVGQWACLRVQLVPATLVLPGGEVRDQPKPHPHDTTLALLAPLMARRPHHRRSS
jgi:RNA polymerase sigma-70 factor (ECF subfamily)